MSEILLAIAPIPRREQGNFSTPTRNFLDRLRSGTHGYRCRGFGFISGASMRFAY
jgi:hypothetical protein